MNRREFMGMAALLPWLTALPAEVLAAPASPTTTGCGVSQTGWGQ